MTLNLKPYLIIFTSMILIFILFGLLRNFIFQKQLVEWGEKDEPAMKAIVFTAFLICVAVAMPVFLKIFVTRQIRIGKNGLSKIETGSLFTELNAGYIDRAGNIVADNKR